MANHPNRSKIAEKWSVRYGRNIKCSGEYSVWRGWRDGEPMRPHLMRDGFAVEAFAALRAAETV